MLPFDNMSGDPEQDYFADGITEDIITDLSRSPALFVIARNSSFAYKGKALDVRQVAASSASATCSRAACGAPANRVRITAQLIDGDDRRPSLGGALRPRHLATSSPCRTR